jgi:hypothetical protein
VSPPGGRYLGGAARLVLTSNGYLDHSAGGKAPEVHRHRRRLIPPPGIDEGQRLRSHAFHLVGNARSPQTAKLIA